jgi:hypothetical protein
MAFITPLPAGAGHACRAGAVRDASPRISHSCSFVVRRRTQAGATARRLRGAPVRFRMQAVPTGPPKDDESDAALPAAGVKTKAQEKEDSVEQTWWGLAWFVVIIAVMSLGIVATLARDFVPGGLGPAL